MIKNKYFLALLVFLISCTSKSIPQSIIGSWKASEDIVYHFTKDKICIETTLDVKMMIINSKAYYSYTKTDTALKLKYLDTDVTQKPKQTPENILLHDTYAKSEHVGPKEFSLKFKLKDNTLTLTKEDKEEGLILHRAKLN